MQVMQVMKTEVEDYKRDSKRDYEKDLQNLQYCCVKLKIAMNDLVDNTLCLASGMDKKRDKGIYIIDNDATTRANLSRYVRELLSAALKANRIITECGSKWTSGINWEQIKVANDLFTSKTLSPSAEDIVAVRCCILPNLTRACNRLISLQISEDLLEVWKQS